MVDQKIEQETAESTNPVENALNALWEKAREASLLISTLHEEKKSLLKRIEELEEELDTVRNDVSTKQSSIEQLRNEIEQNGATPPLEGIVMDAEEKHRLESKVRNIIAKLDQYLSS